MAHRQWCDRECDSPRDQSSPEGSGDLLAPHKRGGGLATPRVLQGGEMEEARDSSSYVDPRRCCMRPMKSERSPVAGPPDGRRRLLAVIRSDFERITASFERLPVTEWVPIPGWPDVVVPYKK